MTHSPSCARAWFLLTLLALDPASLRASPRPLEVHWNELRSLITSQRVTLTLHSGARIEAEAVAVRDDSLLLDVRSGSGPGSSSYPPGSATIPRPAIAAIDVHRTRGAWGRTLGTTLGIIAGLVTGTYAAIHTDSAGAGLATFGGVTGGAAVAGYYAGRRLDRKTTHLVIVP